MANLEDLSASARGLIIGTMNDLDGEYLKCLNMVSLCDIIIEKETQDETISVFTVVLRQYWAFRMGMLSEINNCLSALDLHCDEVDRFVRHNMLGNDAPGPVNQPFPAETPA